MSDWNQGIIEEFRANEGRVGGPFEGAPMVLIHHKGARTGTQRVTPLIYFPQPDDTMLIVASKAGAPTNPDWYHSLLANPVFDVEVGTEQFGVEATELDAQERAVHWPQLVAAMPGFGEYQANTQRMIPVLRLRRS